MTEKKLREKVCAVARGWLNLCEPTSYLPILNIYNNYARQHGMYIMTTEDPWCAMFTSACFIKAGIPLIMPVEVSCYRMVNQAKNRGIWVEDDAYLPKPGDIIQYDWQDNGVGDNIGAPDHVGLVVSVSGNNITIIEGNCSDAVKQLVRVRDQRYIRGYITPDYASVADDVDDDESDDDPVPIPMPSTERPMIRFGAVGEYVTELQNLLIKAGYDVGPDGADGEFGPNTKDAVLKFQSDNSLEVDGVVGPYTWAALDQAASGKADDVKPSEPEPTEPAPVDTYTPAIGEVVQFTGDMHYVGSNNDRGYPCSAGLAKVTIIASEAKHPYHLIGEDGVCTVYGWVDADKVKKN